MKLLWAWLGVHTVCATHRSVHRLVDPAEEVFVEDDGTNCNESHLNL
jgi:hypothetical protein